MAHNYNKMKSVAILFLQIGLILFALVLFFKTNIPYWISNANSQMTNNTTNSAVEFDVFSNIISIISFFLPILWQVFDKWLWKIEKINHMLLLTKYSTPIIEGRWKGKLYRGTEVRDFVIEIRQTFTQVYCKTFSPTSFSRSKIADFLFNTEQDCIEYLFFLWEGKTTNTNDGSESTNLFYGTTLLQINEELRQLNGEYFTNRQPAQTKGTINLSFVSKKLYNSFKET